MNNNENNKYLDGDSRKRFINKQIIFISLVIVISIALLILSWLISMEAFYTVVIWSFPIIATIAIFYIMVLTLNGFNDMFCSDTNAGSMVSLAVVVIIYTIGSILGFNLYKSVLTGAIKEGYEFYIPIINHLVDLGV